MTYKAKFQELVELSHSDNPTIRENADAWLVSIGLQDAAELKVSAFLLDLAVRNVKGEICILLILVDYRKILSLSKVDSVNIIPFGG